MADDPDLSYDEKIAKATLLILIEQRTAEHESNVRSELLLARAGFNATEIAEILNKQAGAVRMAISRARKG